MSTCANSALILKIHNYFVFQLHIQEINETIVSTGNVDDSILKMGRK